jgi:adhesin transport system outer membrane protein
MNSNLYVRVTQLLFDAGALFRRIEAAEFRVEAQRLGLRLTAQSLALKALGAWYDVVRHTRRVALAEANLQRHQVLLEMIGEGVAGKAYARPDLLRAQSREADARATLAAMRGDLERAQAAWAEYFGEQTLPRQLPSLRPVLPATTEAARARLHAGSLELARLEQLAQAANRDFDAERANLLPQVSVQLTGRQFQLDKVQEKDNEVVAAVQLSYPLYTGGSQTARREQAASRAGAARSDVDSLRGELEREVRAALADVTSQTQRLRALELALQAEEATILAYLEQFGIGRRSLSDLLDAQRDLFSAALALVDGTTGLELAHYTVSAALGESLAFFDLDQVGSKTSLR